mmetsp:Transcript_37301/g.93697  ORF Transcript_37301/g.93697 Transcript_37301/m.93697 type:complete len:316 (-) Transcript_37301:39-986(-)|eukprot:CAMPEP_0177669080 /NCGR_PEP_ID=MMETSP0447-20121125/23207_1 /TAXON_ID=0 /ORGANISM="Stygamoeba regulata, Strain BSH-02190019" /LENGTH=315 /DNA_ID=CAMNT_0019175837 /DNA_START=40 /DNA_END=987 /DNA_ORIENTATION=-
MSALDKTKENLHHIKKGVWNALVGPSTKSRFSEKATLTPAEFVEAGDALVYKCPTWKWMSGEQSKQASYLPTEKQFLMTKNVPVVRASTTESSTRAVVVEGDEDGWFTWEEDTGASGDCSKTGGEAEEIPDISSPERAAAASDSDGSEFDSDSDDDIPDMEEFVGSNVAHDDPSALAPAAAGSVSKLQKNRTYDVCIAYDQFYQTPVVWLTGYDESGAPIDPKEIFKDVSADHAHKTVTLGTHPHLGLPYAYIHPCKHAEMMKKIISARESSASSEEVPDDEKASIVTIEQYMFIFLKFISAAIPNIEYDFTMDS